MPGAIKFWKLDQVDGPRANEWEGGRQQISVAAAVAGMQG